MSPKTNDQQKKKVCLLFRKRASFFSIERVFGQLLPELEKALTVEVWEAEHSTPQNFLHNVAAVRRLKADIFHITGDIHYVALGLRKKRTILTVHDCVFLYNSTGLKRALLKWLFLDMPVKRSQLVTAISERTKQDIVKYTGCRPEKVVVVPDPVDDHICYEPKVFDRELPVLLFIGSTPNKNLERVIPALSGIPSRLEIIGRITPANKEALERSGIRYGLQQGLSNEAMAAKYRECDIVLFPSTFEGFGLPIVEGQKAGRPVITSNLSPMKEVAAGAACLVDPYDPASIREGILTVINDSVYREKLIREGLSNAANYTPERIARRYLECYQGLSSIS